MPDNRPNLNEINIEAGYFDTKKRRYYIQPDKLSVIRYREYLELSTEVVYNQDIKEVVEEVNYINKLVTGRTEHENPIAILNQVANKSFNLSNQLLMFTSKTGRTDKLLQLCALFCNYAGEDIGAYDQVVMDEKIRDWEDSKINVRGFFLLASIALNQLTEHFQYIAENQKIDAMPAQEV